MTIQNIIRHGTSLLINQSIQYGIWLLFWIQPFVDRDFVTDYLTTNFMIFYIVWILPLLCISFYKCIEKSKLFECYRVNTAPIKEYDRKIYDLTERQFWHSQLILSLIHIYCNYNGMIPSIPKIPAPSRLTSAFQVILSLVVVDFLHYWYHRMFHLHYFYRFHKIHHQFVRNIAMAVKCISLLEIMTGIMAMLLVPIFVLNMHITTVWMWVTLTVCRGYYEHSGYNLPIEVLQLIPFDNNVKHHDDHHRYNCGNFGVYFDWWDDAFGTLIPSGH